MEVLNFLTASAIPNSSASEVTACPIETSTRLGSALTRGGRLSRVRSCPALRPRPAASAALHAKVTIAIVGKYTGMKDAYKSLIEALSHGGIYTLLLAAQVLFYGAAGLGWWRASQGKAAGPLLVPLYFTMMNVAVFQGAARFWRNSQPAAWDKAQRAPVA